MSMVSAHPATTSQPPHRYHWKSKKVRSIRYASFPFCHSGTSVRSICLPGTSHLSPYFALINCVFCSSVSLWSSTFLCVDRLRLPDHLRSIAIDNVPALWHTGLEQIFDGIKKNAERAKSDPEFAKRLQERSEADYYGRYVPSK